MYRYFPDKEAIVEALAVRYWSDFEDLVAAAAEADELNPLPDPAGGVLDALAAGSARGPASSRLWYGGLRTEQVRDATRPTREAIAALDRADPGRALARASARDRAAAAAWSCWPATGCCARRSGATGRRRAACWPRAS